MNQADQPTGPYDPDQEPAVCPDLPGLANPQLIGRGGMGMVFRVQYHGKTRALKTIAVDRTDGDSGEIQARLEMEMQALERLRHPHIVELVKRFPRSKPPCFLMEYCPDGNLEESVRRDGPSTDGLRVARDFQMICEAVAYAHSQGVAHRDLKPSNILRSATQWKLTDFGLARLMHRGGGLTRPGAGLGTARFSAPEQLAGAQGDRADAWRRADIYSLGAILCFMLTGAAPEHPLGKLVPDEPKHPNWQTADGRLRRICLQCLRRLPSQRYACVEELLDDLRRFQEDEPVAAQPVRLRDRVEDRWLRWRSQILVAAGVVALALAVIIPVLRKHASDKGEADLQVHYAQEVNDLYARAGNRALAADSGVWERILALPEGRDKFMLRCLMLPRHLENNNRPRLLRELDDLTARADEFDADAAKSLALWRADPAVNPREQWDRLRGLMRPVLERRGRLSSEDEAYTRALDWHAAGDSDRAVVQLAALGMQHHRASRLRLRILLELGRYSEARILAEQLRREFAADPLPVLAEAMLDLVEDKVAEARAKIDLVCRNRSAAQQAALREFWHHAVAGRAALFQFFDATYWQGFGLAVAYANHMDGLKKALADEALEPAVLELPLGDRLAAALEVVLKVHLRRARPSEPEIRLLEETNRRNPEALLLLVAGAAELNEAVDQGKRGYMTQAVAEIRRAREHCRQGQRTPTLDPRVHFQCELIEAVSDIFLLRRLPEEIDGFKELMDGLVKHGQPWPQERQRILPAVVEGMIEDVHRQQFAAWNLTDPKNYQACEKRRQWLLSLGDAMLEEWRKSPPVDEQRLDMLYRQLMEARQRPVPAPP